MAIIANTKYWTVFVDQDQAGHPQIQIGLRDLQRPKRPRFLPMTIDSPTWRPKELYQHAASVIRTLTYELVGSLTKLENNPNVKTYEPLGVPLKPLAITQGNVTIQRDRREETKLFLYKKLFLSGSSVEDPEMAIYDRVAIAKDVLLEDLDRLKLPAFGQPFFEGVE